MRIPKKCQIEKIIGKRDRRPAVNCAWLETESNRLVATNGHALAFVPAGIEEGVDVSGPIPIEALAAARKKPAIVGDRSVLSAYETYIEVPGHDDIARPVNVPGKPDFDHIERNYSFEAEHVIKIDAKLLHALAKAIGSDCVSLTLSVKNPQVNVIKVEPANQLTNEARGYLMPVK